MDERDVVKAVEKWLEGQGFTVEKEFLIDESGRPGPLKRPDLAEPEKHVMAWARAHARGGVTPVDLEKGLSDLVPRDRLRESVDHLVKLGEVEVRRGRLHPGPFPRSGSFVLPCPVRPDLYGLRGKDRIERWTVECKGSRGDIAHGIGQAHLYGKVSERAHLALPSDWPPIYDGKAKAEPWAVLRQVALSLNFGLLQVDAKGTVRPA